MTLDESVWLPKYWFVLTTIACQYPNKPNDVTKKKYYELIQNLPLFMPEGDVSNHFLKLLDKYPVTPYLDDRASFMKWSHFIQNKVNASMGYEEKTTADAMQEYYDQYKPRELLMREVIEQRTRYLFLAFLGTLALGGIYLYKK